MTTGELLIIETYLGADSFRMTELVPVAETLLAEVKRLHAAADERAERHCDGPNCPFGCGEADRNARFVEKVLELVDDTNPTELTYYIKTWRREIYNAPCKPVEPVKEHGAANETATEPMSDETREHLDALKRIMKTSGARKPVKE